MLAFWMMLVTSVAAMEEAWHPAVDQAVLRQIRDNSPKGLMSISSGAPVSAAVANSSLNQPLIHNAFLMDHMTSQVRERTRTRTIHIKGALAYGYFEVTHDISHICRASFLNKIGKITPIAARFSSGVAEKGSSELRREIRGFALKFYTDEGNFDIPGIVTPIFVIKNPMYYVNFIHAIRRHPADYLYDPNPLWDMIVKHPESMYAFLMMFGDRGIPKTYRHMPCYNVHSLQVVGKDGKIYFIRFHILPTAGIKHMDTAEAQKTNFADQDFYTRDLHDSIIKGDYPSWNVNVQIVPEADVCKHGFRMFEVTRVLPIKDFPLHPVGKIVLNRNPKNYFAEADQIAFNPTNLVDGILGAPDKIYEARRYAYTDAQLYRLGPHARDIPVNCPLNVRSYSASSDKPGNDGSKRNPGLLKIIEEDPYNFDQARELYEEDMSYEERDRLHENLCLAMGTTPQSVREKVLHVLAQIHPELAYNVARGLNATIAM